MSKIGSLDRTVSANLCRYAFGQLAALMHDHHVVRQGQQQIFNERLSKLRHLRRRTPPPLLHQHWLHNVHMVKTNVTGVYHMMRYQNLTTQSSNTHQTVSIRTNQQAQK